jgi:antirestriction protein ArdC
VLETRKSILLRYFTVFNAEQCEGIKSPENVPVIHSVEQCESIVQLPNPPCFEQDAQACYRPTIDTIGMPARSAFTSAEELSASALRSTKPEYSGSWKRSGTGKNNRDPEKFPTLNPSTPSSR